jgi:hypothetical protein
MNVRAVVCIGPPTLSLPQHREALPHIVGLIDRVGIHPDKVPAPGRPDGDVEAGRNDATRIVQQPDVRMAGGHLFEIFTGAVGGHSVRDENLERPFRQVLVEGALQRGLDVALLVAAGQDDGDDGIHGGWVHVRVRG